MIIFVFTIGLPSTIFRPTVYCWLMFSFCFPRTCNFCIIFLIYTTYFELLETILRYGKLLKTRYIFAIWSISIVKLSSSRKALAHFFPPHNIPICLHITRKHHYFNNKSRIFIEMFGEWSIHSENISKFHLKHFKRIYRTSLFTWRHILLIRRVVSERN